MEQPISCTSVLFKTHGELTPGRVELYLRAAGGAFEGAVHFVGVDRPDAVASGETELEALSAALRAGTHAIEALRARGVEMLYEERGWAPRPLEWNLETFFRSCLKQFGLPDEPLRACIVDGPVPEEWGSVKFVVRVGDELVDTFADPCGVGCRTDEPVDAVNPAMKCVFRFIDEHRAEMLPLYRQAGRLRRAAGNPPPVDLALDPDITLARAPVLREHFVEFWIAGVSPELRVLLFANGAYLDDCDDWLSLSDHERQAAIARALLHVLDDHAAALRLGLDPDLFEDLYR